LFRDEATFHYLFLKFYIGNERDEALAYIRDHHLDTKNNHLFAYLAVNLSLNNQQSDNAKDFITSRNMSAGYLQTPIWDLELGYALMNHLDEEAVYHFEKFLRNFKGKYYVKDVLHKLSWYYYLKDSQEKATYYRALILQKGSGGSEADQSAYKEAKTGKWPDKLLLRVRLLNDGGYYQEALALLQGKKASDFKNAADQLEFVYRVGRLYDDTGRDKEAADFYKDVIDKGENRKEYYAARAALQLGYIYEQQNDRKTAIYWYNRCLTMKDHDYKSSLDQRAKAGMARCE
jgi:hypothetical protein